ncbi:MAG: transketolase, partial [bacterium]|nr:transketolase [bacterium]
MQNAEKLKQICKLIRYDILTSTTAAGSGHPSSSLSAVELMTTLFFDGFLSYSIQDPSFIFNDRVVFSKGHAAPLLYSLYHAAGVISYEELMTLRKFDSVLEGHPTPRFKMIDVSTGSLGQGLSVGIGMALGIKLKVTRVPKVFVLLGDSEMAEGQIWEAMQLASHYKLNNLVGILDVNRLGQRGETMLEWDLKTYEKRIKSFGWNTIVVDGHDLKKVQKAFTLACSNNLPPTDAVGRPTMIIAKTIKGKGVSFMENKDGWHGKPVPKDMLKTALKELGKIDLNIRGKITLPKFQITNNKSQTNSKLQNSINNQMFHVTSYKLQDLVATREAYGNALVHLGTNENIVVLDGETSNSTYAEKFKKIYPNRFFEMYIAEQNMISVALGFSKIGYIPFSSSFAAFLTRAFDQMRIAQYS